MALAVQSVVQHMMCGDEIKAVVIDMGESSCKFGFAGQDLPRWRFRSDIGVVMSEKSNSSSSKKRSKDAMDEVEDESESNKRGAQDIIVGDNNLRFIRNDLRMEKVYTSSSDASNAKKKMSAPTENATMNGNQKRGT